MFISVLDLILRKEILRQMFLFMWFIRKWLQEKNNERGRTERLRLESSFSLIPKKPWSINYIEFVPSWSSAVACWFLSPFHYMGFPGGSEGKACLQCRRPGFNPWVRKIPWRKEMATHSSTLAWKFPWTEKPARLQSMGSQSWTQLSKFTLSITDGLLCDDQEYYRFCCCCCC